MTNLFNQLGFVSAIMAGFAFTFVGGLLSSNSPSRAFNWVFGAALFAAVALLVAAVGSVFIALGLDGQSIASHRLDAMRNLVSKAFLLGMVSLVASSGGAGFLRGRKLGYFSMVIGAIGLVGLFVVVAPFLGFS